VRPLSQLTFELLRVSQAHADTRAFSRYAQELAQRFSERAIAQRLHQLTTDGLIVQNGHPAKGWLTPKGKAILERHPSR
jgi:repressor of nif and glnA expression